MHDLPADLAVRREPAAPGRPAAVEIDFRLEPGLACFPDHFPGFPMLAGVVQLGWAVDRARREFGLATPPRRLAQLKFQHPILPDTPLTLRLVREAATEVAFSYRSGARACSSGRLIYDEA